MATISVVILVAAGAGVAATLVWVRSAQGWSPGATWAEAARELAAHLYPRAQLSRERVRARLWAAARNQVLIDGRGRSVVPTSIDIALAPADMAALDGSAAWVSSDVADHLEANAARHGWELTARPVISLHEDPERPVGRPLATADFTRRTVSEPPAPPQPGGTRSAPVPTLEATDGSVAFGLAGDGPYRIGRDRSCELRVADERVSRSHARVERSADGWRVVDLGSTNGVKLNGEPVRAAALHDGDVLALSSGTMFRFCAPTGGPPATGPAAGPGGQPAEPGRTAPFDATGEFAGDGPDGGR